MTDIVERLRNRQLNDMEYTDAMTREAADEIERLRAALTTIRDAYWSEGEPPDEQRDDLKYIASRALEGKP